MRLKKLWLTILLICCSLLVFAGCKQNRVVERISLKGYSTSSPLEIGIGKFSYSGRTVLVTYNNGETEEVPLTEVMISETDKLKFYQDGKHEISITYSGITTAVQISVLRNQFSDSVKLDDFTATYTGKPFVVEVEGELPGGADVLYPQGNTFQNAGTYDMTAILQCEGYETKVLSARVFINKATYDVTYAQLYDETVIYNKDTHNLAIKGKKMDTNGVVVHTPANLPQGVSVSYSMIKVKDGRGNDIPTDKQQLVTGNKAVDAGTYKVSAHFKGDASNYHAIPDSVAYLIVERDIYDLSKIEFVDKAVTYSGEAHALQINPDSKLPLDVAVSYQIKRLKDGAGQAVTDTYKDGNSAISAGVYAVKASFNVNGKNADNYTTDPIYKEAYLTIKRASYDEEMQGVDLDSQGFIFEAGKTYEIFFDCALPQGVSPQFKLTDDKNETITGEVEEIKTPVDANETVFKTTYKYSFKVEKAGNYSCVITFTHQNADYEEIKYTVTAWVIINSVD